MSRTRTAGEEGVVAALILPPTRCSPTYRVTCRRPQPGANADCYVLTHMRALHEGHSDEEGRSSLREVKAPNLVKVVYLRAVSWNSLRQAMTCAKRDTIEPSSFTRLPPSWARIWRICALYYRRLARDHGSSESNVKFRRLRCHT